MNEARINPPRQAGFTLIEVLVSLLIIVLGLLGLAGMQARIQQAEFESYERSQALILLYDMVDRINVHRETATCFQVTTDAAAGTPYLGVGSTVVPACAASTAADNTMANNSLNEWSGLLLGAAETKGGQSVGAMAGARGCVTYTAGSELTNPTTGAVLVGTGIYTVAVAWQGSIDTAIPTVNCANGVYGAETRRRVVSATLRFAKLN